MQIIVEIKEMISRAETLRRAGKRLGCVPTMGALHEGHLELMREARRRTDAVAASVFVNPTQFAPTEDLAKYPRDREGDLKKMESAGVDIAFFPTAEAMYPKGAQTWVTVEEITQELEGASRPAHFRGVTTVVMKLFHLMKPHLAVFGQKDYQQLKVIERMVKDLDLDVEIVAHPTVREPDELAMSSRNRCLDPEERKQATALIRAIRRAQELVKQGERDPKRLVAEAQKIIAVEPLAKIDYIAVRDPETLKPIIRIEAAARMLLAVRVGNTRLIDNAELNIAARG
jgi:pantoate--beta-alanine ligase